MTETTTLEPLDVSPWATEAEPKALTDFKKKVVEVAKNHSRTHHCGEYKSVLRQLGMEDAAKKIQVKLTSGGFSFIVRVAPDTLVGLGVEKQAEVLIKAIGDVRINADNADAEGVIELNAKSITAWEIQTRPPTEMPGPNDGLWLYAGDDGRVQHFYDYYFEGDTLRRVDGDSMGSYHYALCRYYGWNLPRVTSTRGENRRCRKCEARLRTRSS